MNSLTIQKPVPTTKAALWTGRIISIIIILFLLMDSIMKIIRESHNVQGTMEIGFSASFVQPLGFTLFVITVLYIIPRTALIGAVLLTAYLGGAVSLMILTNKPIWFPIIFCILAWVGLYLKNEKARQILRMVVKD